MRRVTRSQTKKMKEGQRVLADITNDSPIIGLAKAKLLKTPSSENSKKRVSCKIIGSGESLLRGQVKTLLQKVEEKTQLSRIFQENKPLDLPMANSPQIANLFDNQIKELASVTPTLFGNKVAISQMVNEMFEEEKDSVTRSLIFDFMEKLDEYDSSEERREKKITDDAGSIDELCEGMSKMNIEKARKHTRFVYDSDGELIEVQEEEWIVASAALQLKGLPKPEGETHSFS